MKSKNVEKKVVQSTITEVYHSDTLPYVRNRFNRRKFDFPGELNEMEDCTVPDESLTVREMLQRSQKGLLVKGSGMIPVYYGETEVSDLSVMDISEIVAYKKHVDAVVKDRKATLDAEAEKIKALKEAKQLQEKIDKAVSERLKNPAVEEAAATAGGKPGKAAA